MKLIDADKISRLGLTITISERTGDMLKGHARGKEEVIRRAVEVFNQVLFQAPTVDLWRYPSKGELPTEDASYLVTLEHLRGFKERFVTTASYYKEYGWGGFEPLFYRVVAWMPLPEVAKEEV